MVSQTNSNSPAKNMKFQSEKYDLLHPTAITENADMLVVVGDTLDLEKPIAIPVHRQLVAESAKQFELGSEKMNGVKYERQLQNLDIDEFLLAGIDAGELFNYFKMLYGNFKEKFSAKKFKKKNAKLYKLDKKANICLTMFAIANSVDDHKTIEKVTPLLKLCLEHRKLAARQVYSKFEN